MMAVCRESSPATSWVKIPAGLTDEQILFLGDIFPTGWQAAAQCDIEPTDTVAIWGAGPGRADDDQKRSLARREAGNCDRLPERLMMARAGGATTIDVKNESVLERLKELTRGQGPKKCIDAVGMESHATRSIDSILTARSRL